MGNNVKDIISLCNVSLKLNGRKILEDVSFTVQEGETFVILGPSGAGKSSILKVLLGLWKPDSGSVFIKGAEMSSLNENQMMPLRKKIGIVFQGNALFDSLNVQDNISYFLKERNSISERDIDRRVKECLAFVNLENAENLYPEELSGGMKKRVAIARAIAFKPDIILYDEPTTGIDPINVKILEDLILKIQNEGTTSIIVTHYVTSALRLGNSFALIKDGSIILNGSNDDILNAKDDFVKEFFSDYQPDEKFLQKVNK